jgi:hypothetical protein
MSKKRKIFSVTEMANTADFNETDSAKVPAHHKNICGDLNMETDENMADDSQLYGFSLAIKNLRLSQNNGAHTSIHYLIRWGTAEQFIGLLKRDGCSGLPYRIL